MYYVWRQDWEFPDAEEIDIPEIWDDYSLFTGKHIDVELPPIHFRVSTLHGLSDALVNRWGYLVFSPKLRDVIARITIDEVQYLKAVVSHKKTGKQFGDYRLANLLVEIQAIDQKRSSLEYYEEGDVSGINSLVLDETKIGEHSLFRLDEFSSTVIVREDVARAIEQSGCKGVKFVSIEEYRA